MNDWPALTRRELDERYGTDYGISDEDLAQYIERAEAKRRALGYGSVMVMAASLIHDERP